MIQTPDIALVEVPGNLGMTAEQINECLNRIKPCERGYVPVQIESDAVESTAMGFATADCYEDFDFDFAKTSVESTVRSVMWDEAHATPDGKYAVTSPSHVVYTLWLGR